MKPRPLDRLRMPLRGVGPIFPILLFASAGFGGIAPAAAQEAPAAPDGEQQELAFPIMEYVIRGNTTLEPADIQRALTPFLGPDRSVSDVQEAQAALVDLYQAKGYVAVSVDVPPQDATDGVIEFAVREGEIGQVTINAGKYVSEAEVRRALPELRTGAIPNVPEIQAALRTANARPGRRIEPRFTAGEEPGSVDIALDVEAEKPWTVSAELADQFNRSTERLRANLSASYSNLWGRGHSANLFYQFTPEAPEQVQVFSGSYYLPLDSDGTSFVGYAVVSNTDVGSVGDLIVVGDGLNIGGRLIHTFDSNTPGVANSIFLGVDYKDYVDEIGLTRSDGTPLTFPTPVEYLPFTVQYRSMRARPSLTQTLEVGTTFAFDGIVGDQAEFGGRIIDDPRTPQYDPVVDPDSPGKRAGASASFFYVFGNLEQEWQFPSQYSLNTALNFQYSPEPLISNEQFALGGRGSVRGYRVAEALADWGVRSSIQFGRNYDRLFGPAFAESSDLHLYLFADGAYGELQSPLPEEDSEFGLASIGVGANALLYNIVNIGFDAAYQFSDDPSSSGNPVEDDLRDLRIHFNVGLEY